MADDAECKGCCARPPRTTRARALQGRSATAKDAALASSRAFPLRASLAWNEPDATWSLRSASGADARGIRFKGAG